MAIIAFANETAVMERFHSCSLARLRISRSEIGLPWRVELCAMSATENGALTELTIRRRFTAYVKRKFR